MHGKRLQEMEQWYAGLTGICPTFSRIRKFLIWKFGPTCTECGWMGKNPFSGFWVIELDHIDGCRENNSPSNLRLLCPNCHAMTQTYKSLNRGDARDSYGPCHVIVDEDFQ